MRTYFLGLAVALSVTPDVFAARSTGTSPESEGTDTTPLVDSKEVSPPGLVALPGGKTIVGADPDDLEEILQPPALHGFARSLDGETPQFDVRLPPFFIGKYEVTNEQYIVFVKATGVRPPEHWGQAAISAAQAEFGRKEAEKAKAALEEGGRYERRKWTDQLKEKWWTENWQEAEWSIPEGQERVPVSFVDYRSATAYADWAGLRLPTEAEWEHAARGAEKQPFPWGDEWEATGHAHTNELRRGALMPIASFPSGASPYGILDMAGSVWEWTSSPYDPHPRFKPNKYKVKATGGKKKPPLEPTPRWDTNMRVMKGGSFQNELIAARVSTRRPSNRDQTAAAVGFRLASSALPARDAGVTVYRDVISSSPVRSNGEKFDFDAAVGIDRWTTSDVEGKAPEGYAVIEGYERIVLVPRYELELASGGAINRASRVAPVLFGYLSTTVPFAEPKLAPGNYLIAYREAGTILTAGESAEEDVEGEGGEAPEVTDDTPLELLSPAQRLLRQIELQENLIIFMEAETGEYVASMKTSKIVDIKDKKSVPNGIQFEQKTVWVGETVRDKVQEVHD
ncbi:MAG: SUMF1/EgtB/PvdO family nonheme iron enzyme, partial [Planctomycetota bacterium]